MPNPSCFGLPSIFDFESPTCKGCASYKGCVPACFAVLNGLSGELDVGDQIAVFEHHEMGLLSDPGLPVTLREQGETTALEAPLAALPERVRVVLTDAQKKRLLELPIKPAAKLRMLIESGLDKRALHELPRGVNPFPEDGHRYLRVAADLLLKGGFTRNELTKEFMERLNWTKGTAKSFTAQVPVLFMEIGLTEDKDGRQVLKV